MNRLIIVSNRLPVNIVIEDDSLAVHSSIGGLATGLKSFYKSYDSLWVGWPGLSDEEIGNKKNIINKKLFQERCLPVYLEEEDIQRYYYGFSNNTIWPLFHYFTEYTQYNNDEWNSYKHVNEVFFDALSKILRPNDTVWVHDYHLFLLPRMIKEKFPDSSIGFFLHIPFPSYEVFRLLPWREEILNGVLGSDLIGFHTYDYVRHFLSSVRRLFGYEVSFNQIKTDKRILKADTFPMGIDYEKFSGENEMSDNFEESKQIVKNTDCHLILSVDRLDYTKGIPQRLEAFDYFLEKYPDYIKKIQLILLVVPSRTNVPEYQALKKHIDELIGKINGKYATLDWTPIVYLFRGLPFNELLALYHDSNIALITPLRDGMNLVAKEFVATKDHGDAVLILSEMAGAAPEMGEAIIVNPNNKIEIVEAIKLALDMPKNEKIKRIRSLQKRLKRYNVVKWAADFTESIGDIKRIQNEHTAKILSNKTKKQIYEYYRNSNKRIIIMGYDGTLVSLEKNKVAKPDKELLKILTLLSEDSNNEVVIVSGRERNILNNWLGDLNIVLVAEHGVWSKNTGKDWQIIEPLDNNWKKEIRPILEMYVDRTPGSFIEEKDFSLSWHYKHIEPDLKSVRSWELKESLLNLIANLNLEILEGSDLIEVKNIGINKGKAASKHLNDSLHDFILTFGDDWTDEYLFSILPDNAISIKVGTNPSQAQYCLESVDDVRSLLKELIN